MSKKSILTKEGLENLEKELEYLKVTKRKEASERIKKALAFGDLSENSEYDEAKNEQALIETRILEIESIIKTSTIVDANDVDTDAVYVGCKVLVKDLENSCELSYRIVGVGESDPLNNKISSDSPVGAALLGSRIGDSVKIHIPNGKIRNFEVLDILD